MIKIGLLALWAAIIYVPVAGAQAPAVGQLLSADPGFENGYANWNQNWAGISSLNTTTPIAGTTSMRLGVAKGGRAQQIVSGIEGGAKYHVSGLAKVAKSGDYGTIGLHFDNSAGVTILDHWVVVSATSTQQSGFDVQAPTGTTSMVFYVFKNFGTQPIDFDNVSMTKIANP